MAETPKKKTTTKTATKATATKTATAAKPRKTAAKKSAKVTEMPVAANGHMAAQEHPVLHDPDFHHAAPGRHLKRHELALAEPLPPEIDQATMGGAAHRVFVHAQPGEERP